MTVTATAPATAFLSTPSARRATYKEIETTYKHVNFYPRPPRGGRPYNGSMFTKSFEISIHALREEGDTSPRSNQSENVISIHALREEGDTTGWYGLQDSTNFYPRPPRGGRPFSLHHAGPHIPISIHALREEGDPDPCGRFRGQPDFYPRPPRGGRPS